VLALLLWCFVWALTHLRFYHAICVLLRDPDKRPSADECIDDPWFSLPPEELMAVAPNQQHDDDDNDNDTDG